MVTYFNLKQKDTNDLMREQLKIVVVPYLRNVGFEGKYPSFERMKEGVCQTLNFQFNKYGKSFAVNLSILDSNEKSNTLRSQRLGTRKKRISRKFNMDHWFKFLRGFIVYRQTYNLAAKEVISMFELEAEAIYKDLVKAIDKNVFCIHLDRDSVRNY